MKRIVCSILLGLLTITALSACVEVRPTPDTAEMEARVVEAVVATLTARDQQASVLEVTPTSTPRMGSAGSSQTTPTHPIATPPVSGSQILSGQGQQASAKFALSAGLAIFRINHTNRGNSHFAIWLLDSRGNRVELLANVIGSFDGSKAVRIPSSGTYLLDVQADGGWTVSVEQPETDRADHEAPLSLSDHGQQASPLISFSRGLAIFHVTHDGNGHFAVWLLDNIGEKVELLVNEIGAFNGSKPVGIPRAGIYILDISADGNWKVEIE